MIGNNTMLLNTATMMQAVQEWLDKRMPECAPEVTNITGKDSTRGTFEITLNERPTPTNTETGGK